MLRQAVDHPTIHMPAVLLLLALVATQCRGFIVNFNFGLTMPAPEQPPMEMTETTTPEAPTTPSSTTPASPTTTTMNPCTQCSRSPSSNPPALVSARPIRPKEGVDANGCRTVSFECPTYQSRPMMIQFNGDQPGPVGKATMTCGPSSKWEYETVKEIKEIHCNVVPA